jgi:hypothetical protein
MPHRAVHPLRQHCLELSDGEPLTFADGYDEAILGIAWREGVALVVYDACAVRAILCRRDGMTREDAAEFFAFNVAGAWVGHGTPFFVETLHR